MHHVKTLFSTVSVALLAASVASAQVAPVEPVAAKPPAGVSGLLGTTGGITGGVVIAVAVAGSLLVLTILNSDGTISTTTTTASD